MTLIDSLGIQSKFVKVGVTLFSNVGYVILEQNSSFVNCTLVGPMQGGIQMH